MGVPGSLGWKPAIKVCTLSGYCHIRHVVCLLGASQYWRDEGSSGSSSVEEPLPPKLPSTVELQNRVQEFKK